MRGGTRVVAIDLINDDFAKDDQELLDNKAILESAVADLESDQSGKVVINERNCTTEALACHAQADLSEEHQRKQMSLAKHQR